MNRMNFGCVNALNEPLSLIGCFRNETAHSASDYRNYVHCESCWSWKWYALLDPKNRLMIFAGWGF
jgi:hypothetical protein